MRLLPRDSAIFQDLDTLAGHLVEAAEVLASQLGAGHPERAELALRLADLERRADGDARAVVRRVTSSFVTPYDRRDLVALAGGLDDCVDALEEAGAVLALSGASELPRAVVEQVALVQRQAELTAAAMGRVRAVRDLAGYWTEVGRLEHEAGRVHRGLLGQLFTTERNAVALVAVKEVSDRLEAAADAFERVARTVELIAAQEA